MKKRHCFVGGVALIALIGGGWSNAAIAGGIKTKCPTGYSHTVCVTYGATGHRLRVGAGPDEVRADDVTFESSGDYNYTRTERGVIVDETGVTLTEGHYDSGYYSTYESDKTTHLGTDGYSEHEDWTNYASYTSTGSSDRSLTVNGFEDTNSDGSGGNTQTERTYVDANPVGGVGAGMTSEFNGGNCSERTTANYDPVAAPTFVDVQTTCP